MNKRKSILILVIFSVMFSFSIAKTQQRQLVGGAVGLQPPTEEIVIKGNEKSARFAHSVHIRMGLICGTCHHDANHEPYSQKAINVMENSNPLRCNSCHNANFANSKLTSRKMIFHARCKECHKKGFNGKHGPTKCNGCHIKKKK